MTSEENYYRKAYKGIDELSKYYQNGFVKSKIKEYRLNKLMDESYNPKVTNETLNAIKLTILIAMMGLNKEKIEAADIINDYHDVDTSLAYADTLKQYDIAKNFFNSSSLINEFKSWLRVKKCPEELRTNTKIIKKIRDSFFHSKYTLETEERTAYTHIKNKSFFEVDIFNNVFYDFVFSYFSNVNTLGLVDNCEFNTFENNINIQNDSDLINFINGFRITKYDYKLENYNGSNAVNLLIQNKLKKENGYQTNNLVIKRELERNGYENIKNQTFELSNEFKNILFKTIKNRYGNDFYQMNEDDKKYIVSLTCEYLTSTNRVICNWFTHFYYLLDKVYDPTFNIDTDEYFYGDEYCKGADSALILLKAYLILYRMQNSSFEELSYNSIDIDLNNDYYLWEEDANANNANTNYINESFTKIFNANPNFSYEEAMKKLICDIIRDSLSHSNVTIGVSYSGETIVVFKDIYKNKAKCLSMSINVLSKFLNSEAFMPKYCNQKVVNDLLSVK